MSQLSMRPGDPAVPPSSAFSYVQARVLRGEHPHQHWGCGGVISFAEATHSNASLIQKHPHRNNV